MIVWDEPKRQANIQKHGVDFAIAEGFEWEAAVTFEDTRFDYGETRFIAIGRVGRRTVTMVFTRTGDGIRIISLRPAHRKERAKYDEQNR